MIAGMDHPVQPRLGKAQFLQEFLLLLRGSSAISASILPQMVTISAPSLGEAAQPLHKRMLSFQIVLGDIGHIQDRLGGDQV